MNTEIETTETVAEKTEHKPGRKPGFKYTFPVDENGNRLKKDGTIAAKPGRKSHANEETAVETPKKTRKPRTPKVAKTPKAPNAKRGPGRPPKAPKVAKTPKVAKVAKAPSKHPVTAEGILAELAALEARRMKLMKWAQKI